MNLNYLDVASLRHIFTAFTTEQRPILAADPLTRATLPLLDTCLDALQAACSTEGKTAALKRMRAECTEAEAAHDETCGLLWQLLHLELARLTHLRAEAQAIDLLKATLTHAEEERDQGQEPLQEEERVAAQQRPTSPPPPVAMLTEGSHPDRDPLTSPPPAPPQAPIAVGHRSGLEVDDRPGGCYLPCQTTALRSPTCRRHPPSNPAIFATPASLPKLSDGAAP